MRSLLILSSLFLAFVDAQLPASPISPHIIHESRTRIPTGWSRLRKHEPSAIIPLRLGLIQSNIQNLEDFLMDVSHPDSPNYGDHWTPSKVAQTFAPSDGTVDTVREWLTGSGLASERIKVTSSKSWIQVNVTIDEAERLLQTEYHVYQHKSGSEHVGCEAYHVPSHIAPHVDLITPTIHFDAVLTKRGASATRHGVRGGLSPKTTGHIDIQVSGSGITDCDTQISPDCLRALYGVPASYKPSVPEKNSFGIVEYTPEAYLQSDLEMYAKTYAPDLVGKSPELVSIDGGVVQTSEQDFNVNSSPALDLQPSMALVTGEQPVTLYQVGDLIEVTTGNNFLDALDGSYCTFEGGDDPDFDGIYPDTSPGGYNGHDCGTVKSVNVLASGYYSDEAVFSNFYIARQCAEYGKLGLMGVTVLFSSGDDGVAGEGGCLISGGDEDSSGTIFSPSFPATCPFVTAVGATQIKQGGTVTDPEIAAEGVIQSGGGFSNYFAMPDYQRAAVSGYLKASPPKGFGSEVWNSTGTSRAIPDISVNGVNYVIASNGKLQPVSGSSAGLTVVGAILTMVNDKRIANGKKPIGFINPAIYSASFKSAFNDITNGTNPGCGTGGFAATDGWDAVTGLGTPKYGELVSAWMNVD